MNFALGRISHILREEYASHLVGIFSDLSEEGSSRALLYHYDFSNGVKASLVCGDYSVFVVVSKLNELTGVPEQLLKLTITAGGNLNSKLDYLRGVFNLSKSM